jgi:glutamate racemase
MDGHMDDFSLDQERAIGVFDSGLGGLSVLHQVRVQMPQENLIYFADQAHVPYGRRSMAEIQRLSEGISRFLMAQGAKVVVVACNTASAAALSYLRERLPDIPFVGMEPAVKPAAQQTTNGRIGVLATPGTFGSSRYAGLLARHAQSITVYEDPCPGLVEAIEAGRLADMETEAIIKAALAPMLEAGVDTLVLACTHYPFVQPLIQRLAGPEVAVIDPAPAVARQVGRVLAWQRLARISDRPGRLVLYSTGESGKLALRASELLGTVAAVRTARWAEDGRVEARMLTGAGDR